jgi:hypothetical protein
MTWPAASKNSPPPPAPPDRDRLLLDLAWRAHPELYLRPGEGATEHVARLRKLGLAWLPPPIGPAVRMLTMIYSASVMAKVTRVPHAQLTRPAERN